MRCLFVPTVMACLAIGSFGIARPAPEPEPTPKQPAMKGIPLDPLPEKIQWDWDRNVVRTRQIEIGGQAVSGIPAIDISELEPGQRIGVSSVSRSPENTDADNAELAFWRDGTGMAVDQTVFTSLKRVDAKRADRLGPAGVIVGQIQVERYDPVRVAEFLVVSGVIDANIHIQAQVTGSAFRSKTEGHWFSLHSNDPYWTNQSNLASYRFGVHIANDGTIRVYNPKYHGRLVIEETPVSSDRTD